MDFTMTSSPDLATWNSVLLSLVQALYGVISPNFRMVAVDHDPDGWRFIFVLEHEDETDREEIDDVLGEFHALQTHPVACKNDVRVTADPLEWPRPPIRVVYRRREP